MKNKRLSFVVFLLCLVLIASIFSGCKKETAQEETMATDTKETSKVTEEVKEEVTPEPEEPVEISIEIFDRGNVPEGFGTLTENRWTEYIQESMLERNVIINFYPIPRSEEQTKINILLAAGDAPDLIYTYSNEAYHRWADEGGLTDITELVMASEVVQQFWAEKPHLQTYAAHRGNYYCVLDGTSIKHIPINFIRKDWLDKLGMDVPETIDEVYDALVAFRDQDPDGVGDVVALNLGAYGAKWGGGAPAPDFWQPSIMSAFGLTEQPQQVVDGKLVWREEMPGFLDYMKWMNKLYNEGLVFSEFVTDTDRSKAGEFFLTDKTGFTGARVDAIAAGGSTPLNHFVVDQIPDVEWVMVERLPNEDGVANWGANPKLWFYNMIPISSSDKAPAVLKYIEWQIEEGGEVLFDGIEGEHYELIDGVKSIIDADYNKETKDFFRYDTSIFKPEAPIEALKVLDSNKKFGEIAYEARKIAEEKAKVSNIRFDRAIESSVKYEGELENIRLEYLNKMIIAKDEAEVEALYNEFLEQYNSAGAQEVIDEMNEVFADMVANGFTFPD